MCRGRKEMSTSLAGLLKKLRFFLTSLCVEEGSPAKRARGLGVGIFSGCFPFFGLQTLAGIFLASVVRGNHLLAAAGTWISNPFTYVPLYWFNYKVGEAFLGKGRHLEGVSQLTTNHIWDQGLLFSSRILLGSSIVGLLLGVTIGLMSYLLFKSLHIPKRGGFG